MGDALLRILGRYLVGKVLFLVWVLIMDSPLLLLIRVLPDQDGRLYSLGWIAVPWVVVSIVMSWMLGNGMAHYMIDEHEMFVASAKRSWYDIRFKLAFIPVVGGLFTPDEDKTKPDEDGD
jgi:hypothetical protein